MTPANYIRELQEIFRSGMATEHSFRGPLQQFLGEVVRGVRALNEPTRDACGAPDFSILRNDASGAILLGHVETKYIDADLDAEEAKEQLLRYRGALGNLVLTNYIEFRWYVNGECRLSARLGRLEGRRIVAVGSGQEVIELLSAFMNAAPPVISDPDELARRLAQLAHLIRDSIIKVFERDEQTELLLDIRNALAKALLPHLDKAANTGEFADVFAQTLAYGLFAARCYHPEGAPFRRQNAAEEIPSANPLLRSFFHSITGPDLAREPFAPFVEDLVNLLDRIDLEAVLGRFGTRARREDPTLHFYETFLKSYDPDTRRLRGVFYTPEPVVSYIVRSVDCLLKDNFDCEGGLGDTTRVSVQAHGREVPRVLVLDPACGTGTFLYGVIDLVREQFMRRGDAGMWPGFVRQHLIPRLYGFEVLMAPYVVAHLKLSLQLAARDLPRGERRQWQYKPGPEERFNIFLTNTLEAPEHEAPPILGPLRTFTEEAKLAAGVKSELPIMVILGNPPYSNSIFKGEWIISLLEDYKQGLGEAKSDLNREEWKFLRFAQWRIDKTGAGIVGFIINNSFINATTHRKLRESLLKSFSEIYILDLHGGVLDRSKTPPGESNENVFDIKQGVAILLLVRKPGTKGKTRIFHAELWGKRAQKFEYLRGHDVSSTRWQQISVTGIDKLFDPQRTKGQSEYDAGWKLTDIFGSYSSGIQTKKDRLAVRFTAEEMVPLLRDFMRRSPEDARSTYDLGKDTSGWSVRAAQEDLRAFGIHQNRVAKLLYRPFDFRYTYYTGKSGGFLGRPRADIMRHMFRRDNIALIAMRQVVGEEYNHVGVTDSLICHGTFYLGNRGQDYLFPLYLFEDSDEQQQSLITRRQSNLSRGFQAELAALLRLKVLEHGRGDGRNTVGPEDVLGYLYAMLSSPRFRVTYKSFLMRDFPRVPLVSNARKFFQLAALGWELVELHLLRAPKLSSGAVRYPVVGSNQMEGGFPAYCPPGQKDPFSGSVLRSGRVYINANGGNGPQYFEQVAPDVWEFKLGGYQVFSHYLEARARLSRELTLSDREHLLRTFEAIRRSLDVCSRIDEALEE